MNWPRSLLRLRLRTLMVIIAVTTVVISGVTQVAPILERRSRYLAMAENCDQVAANHRAKAGQSAAQLAATRAPDAKSPYGADWVREFQGRLDRSIREDRRSAEDMEARARKYRQGASRPWRPIEE